MQHEAQVNVDHFTRTKTNGLHLRIDIAGIFPENNVSSMLTNFLADDVNELDIDHTIAA